MKSFKKHYVYILKCANGDLYTGYTVNLQRRIASHNLGRASKFTRSRTPVKLVHLETFHSKSEALKREFSIKRLTRRNKLNVIEGSAGE